MHGTRDLGKLQIEDVVNQRRYDASRRLAGDAGLLGRAGGPLRLQVFGHLQDPAALLQV